MAAAPPTPAQAELISSLSQEDIPIKLRCAICSKLAVNAFRLPCCDQAICETCQTALPSSCPVCEHSPVSAADCKPNKSLRTTIKVFLRTEEKKREALRLKDQQETPFVAQAEQEIPTPIVETPVEDQVKLPEVAQEKVDVAEEEVQDNPAEPFEPDSVETSGSGVESQDVPQKSIEEIAPGQEETIDGEYVDNDNSGQPGNIEQSEEVETDVTGDQNAAQISQMPAFGMGNGFDPSMAGFPNMGMMGAGVDFNQMQMMMAMQNGMGSGFGGFPMGMPSMSMDPMAMQSMFMNGGFGGNMNGMNMGMGMGMGGPTGGDIFNNGWNGQQSWNIAQDNFKNPNAAGMGPGDFGANNSGFNRQNSASFNQGNYGRTNHFNDYQQNAPGFRGRGRGRGFGYGGGRGGYGYNQNGGAFGQQFAQDFNNGQQIAVGNSDEVSQKETPNPNVDEFGREIRETTHTNADTANLEEGPSSTDDTKAVETSEKRDEEPNSSVDNLRGVSQSAEGTPMPIQSYQDYALPSGFSKSGFGVPVDNHWGVQSHAGTHGNGFVGQSQNIPSVVQIPDVPMNAPKGPKAMRDGLPNISSHFLRGRGGYANLGNRNDIQTNVSRPEETPVPANESSHTPVGDTDEKNDEDRREGSRSRARSERSDREESDEPTTEKRHERRRHRHRSQSTSGNERDDRRRREGRRHHSKKYEDELENQDPEEYDNRDKEEVRSRSYSPAESRRSSRRSRHHESRSERHGDRDRDRDREKDRDRTKDRDRDLEYEHKSSSTSKHRSSHRSNRDKSRSPHRSSRSHRDRDENDKERRHRRHRDSSTESRRDRHSDRDRGRESRRAREDRTLDTLTEIVPKPSTTSKPDIPIDIPKGPRAMSTSTTAAIPRSTVMDIKGAHARGQDEQLRERNHNSNGLASRLSRDENREKREQERSSRLSREDRGKTSSSGRAASDKKPLDPHEAEREKRNRDRLLKEAQRMAGLTGLMGVAGASGKKRSRDEVGAGGLGGKKRRSEVDGAGLEERIAKGESEREGARWG